MVKEILWKDIPTAVMNSLGQINWLGILIFAVAIIIIGFAIMKLRSFKQKSMEDMIGEVKHQGDE